MRTNNQTKRQNFSSFFRKVGALLTGTALLASMNLTTAALANDQGGRNAAFEQFQIANPGLDNKELRQMFKQEWHEIKQAGKLDGGAGGGMEAVVNIQNQAVQNINNNGLDRSDFASKAEWQAAKQAFKLEQKGISDTINKTVQLSVNNKFVNVNAGFALDLSSAVQSITLGDNLFKKQDSVTINIGGQEKTLSAGSKVTAAEYVAAKQAMAGGAQSVTLDADGRATGGTVDLSAMTAGNKTMKVTDLTVPVSVVASGDFGKSGDVKISGDLTNSGSINAYSSNGKVDALIRADNITNNAGASISSTVSDLTLHADDTFANYGDISATGNLTLNGGNSLTNSGNVNVAKNLSILSPNVTNSGNLASANGNITFDTPVAAAMNINNTNGTVSALNGAINIRDAGYNAAFDSNVNGGDLLSRQFNTHSGLGTIDVDVNKLTGEINQDGFGSHISSNSDLNLGTIKLYDPTYKSTGNINIGGDITVTGENLVLIAQGDITDSGTFTVQAAGATAGFDITMVAGANITSAGTDTTDTTTPTAVTTTFNLTGGNSGSIILDQLVSITTRPTDLGTGTNGGNVFIAAHSADSTTAGNVFLEDVVIDTRGRNAGNSGNVTILAGGDGTAGPFYALVTNTILAGGAGAGTGASGNVLLSTSNPAASAGGSITYLADGSLQVGSETLIDSGIINSNPAIILLRGDITTGQSGLTGNVSLRASGTIARAFFGVDVTGNSISLESTGGSIGNSPGDRIGTDGVSLSASAASGSVYILESNALNVVSGNAANEFNILSSFVSGGDLDIQGSVSANVIDLDNLGGDIQLNNTLTSSGVGNQVVLSADGSITGTSTVSGTTVSLTATNGNIGTSAASRVSTNATNLDATANAATVGNGNAWINEADGVTLNASSANKQFLLNTLAAGDVDVQGAVTGNDVRLTTFATGGGNILLNNTLTSSGVGNQVVLFADGSITGASTVSGTTVSLTATNGNIGTSAASRVSTNATNLNATANAATVGNGNVWIDEANGVTLNASSANKQFLLNTLAAGDVDVQGAVTGNDIQLTTFATGGGNILLNNSLTSSGVGNQVVLSADGSITGASTVSGTTVSLTATNGNIGTSAASRVSTSAANLSATANAATVGNGNVWINEANGVSLNASSANKQFLLNTLAAGDVDVQGAVTGNDVRLTTFATGGGNILLNNTLTSSGVGNQVVLFADGSITGASTVSGTTVSLTATNGNIGTSAASRVSTSAANLSATANAATVGNGNVWINEANGVSLNASSANKQFLLNTLGAGDVNVQGAVTGNDVRLTTFATGGGNILLNNTITGTGGSDQVILSADGSITGASTVSGTTVSLTATNGNIGTSAASRVSTAAGTLALTANSALAGQGNAWVTEANAVSILASSVDKELRIDTTANGTMSVDGAVSGNVIQLTTAGGSTNHIDVNATITGTGTSTIGLSAGGTGRIRGSAVVSGTTVNAVGGGGVDGGTVFSGTTVSLTATTGNVGTSAASRVNTTATNLDVTANDVTVGNGNAWINEANGVSVNASSVNKQFLLNTLAAGSIDIDGAVSANDVQLTTFGAGQAINVNSTLSAPSVTLNSDVFNMTGSINAGAGTVTIRPITNGTSISVAGGAATLNISSTELANITAGILVVGDRTLNGGITVGGDVDVSGVGAGAYNLTFLNNGNFTSAGQTITLGDKNLTIDVGGSITTGPIDSTSGNVDLTAVSNITTGTTTTTSGNVIFDAGNNINAGVTSTDSGNITMDAGNNIVMGATSTNTGTINVDAGGTISVGDIVSNEDVILITAGTLNVANITTTGDIYLKSTAGGINTTGDLLADPIVMISALTISLGGDVTANDGILIVSGQNIITSAVGAININGSSTVGDAGAVTIVAGANFTDNGIGNDVVINGASATGGNIDFTQAGGLNSITSDSSFAGGSGGNMNLIAYGTGAGLNGRVLLPTSSTIATTGNGAGTNGNLTVVAGGNNAGNGVQLGTIVTALAGTGGDVDIFTAAPGAGVTIGQAVTDTGEVLAGTFLGGATRTANITTADITSVGADVTATAGRNATFGSVTSDTMALTATTGSLASTGIISGTTSVSLTARNSITNAQFAGGISAPSLSLTSTIGSIGASGDALVVDAATLSANSTIGSVFIANLAQNIILNASSGSTFELTRTSALAGDITVNGPLQGNNVSLLNAAGNGGVVVNDTISAIGGGNATSVTLTATGSGAISTDGAAITTNALNLTSGSGDIGAGTAINTNANSLTFNTTGDVTITDTRAGTVTLNASSADDATVNLTTNNSSLVVAGDINAANDLTLTTAAAGTGNISRTGTSTLNVGNLLTLTAGGNIGSLATPILTAAASITATAGAGRSIFISEADGVTLNALAAGNAINVSAGGTMTINGMTANNITLSTTNGGDIVRSSGTLTATTLAMSSDFGNIGQTPAAFITTTASNISASTTGTVLISSSNAGTTNFGTISGSSVALLTAGNMNLSQNVIGTTSVFLQTSGAGNITQTPGTSINTASLSLNSTTGSFGSQTSFINTNATQLRVTTTGAGDAFVHTTNSLFLLGSSADTFTLVSDGSIVQEPASTTSSNNLTLQTTNNGSITLDGTIQALAAGPLTVNLLANGSGNIVQNSGAISNAGQDVTLVATSGSGNIGSGANRLTVVGSNINVAANTSGNVFLDLTGDAQVSGSASAAPSTFNVLGSATLDFGAVNAGSIVATSTGGPILVQGSMTSASTAALTAGAGSDISFLSAGSITAPTSITLTVSGAGGEIINGVGASAFLSTNTLNASSGAGSIGVTNNLFTNAANINVSTTGGNIAITDNRAGVISLNTLNAGAGNATFVATGAGNTIDVVGTVAANNLSLSTNGGTNGSITLTNGVTGTTSVTLSANGSGSISGSGLIDSPTVTLTSGTGNIGTFSSRVQTNASDLTANTAGQVWINDINGAGIDLGLSSGSSFNLSFSSDLSVNGAITGDSISLTANGATDAGVNLSAPITGTTSVTIAADGAGEIQNLIGAAAVITAPTVTLSSGSGDIGAPNPPGPNFPIFVNATNISATTTGSIYINNLNTGTVNIGPLSGDNLFFTNGGTINVVGILDFVTDVSLITTNNGSINVGFNILAGNSITLTAGGNGSVTQAAGTILQTPTLTVTSSTGNLGSATNQINTNASTLTAFTGGSGNAWITDINTGNIVLAGTSGAGGTFTLTTTNSSGTSVTTGVGGVVQGNNAVITSLNGSVGTLGANLSTDLVNLQVTAPVNVFVDDAGSLNLLASSAGNGAGNTFFVNTNGNLTSTGVISGNAVTLRNSLTSGGSIALGAAVNAVTDIALVSDASLVDGAFTVLNAPNIALVSLSGDVGTAGNALDLTSTNVPSATSFAFSALAGQVNVSSTLASDVSLNSFVASGFGGVDNQAAGDYSFSSTGNVNVDGSVVSTSGDISVTSTAGDLTTIGVVTNIGLGAISLNGVNVTTNAGVTGNGLVTLTGTTNVTTNSLVSGDIVTLNAVAGALDVNSNVDGSTSINLISAADITNTTITGAVLTTPQLNLTSTAGSIGSSGSRLALTDGVNVTDPLSMTLNATGNAYVSYTGADLTIGGGKSTVAGVFDVSSTGDLTTTGDIDPTDVVLHSDGDMLLNSVISATNSITLTAVGNIDNPTGSLQTPGILTATSDTGWIGTNAVRLNTQVGTIALHATLDGAYATNTGGDLIVNQSNAATDLCIDTEGTMTVAGALTGNGVSLLATTVGALNGDILINAGITASGANSVVDISADRDVISTVPGTISGNSILVFAGRDLTIGGAVTGTTEVGDTSDSTLLFNATGAFSNTAGISGNSISVTADTIQLNALVQGVNANNVVDLTADQSITAANINGNISAETLNLTSNTGDIGGPLVSELIQTSVSFLSLNAAGDAFVINDGNVALNASTVGGILNLQTEATPGDGGDITISGAVNASFVDISANAGGVNAGNLAINAAVNGTSDVFLTGANNVTSTASGVVTSPNINITAIAGDMTLAGNVGTAGVGTVTLTAGNDLTTTTATVEGNVIDITATGGAIALGSAVTSSGASNSTSLTSNDDINAAAVSQVTATTLNLTSTAGNIGTVGTPVSTSTSFISLNSFGDAVIEQDGAVSVLSSNIGGDLSFTTVGTGGGITFSGVVTVADDATIATGGTNGGDITFDAQFNANGLNASTLTGDINVNAALVGTGVSPTITLNSDQALTSTASGTMSANVINLTAATTLTLGASVTASGTGNSISLTSGNDIVAATVGFVSTNDLFMQSTGGSIGSSGSHVVTAADNLRAIAADNVYIDSTVPVILGNSSAGGTSTFSLETVDAGESITIAGTLSGNDIQINSAGDLFVNNAVTGTGLGSVVNLVGADNFTSNATGTVSGHTISIEATAGAISLGAAVDSTGGGAGNSVSLTSSADITQAAVSQIVSSPETLNLTSTAGNIGVLGTEILLNNPVNVSLNAANNAFVISTGNLNLLASNAGGLMLIDTTSTTGGSIQVSGTVTAGDVSFSAGGTDGGNITVNGTINASNAISLSSNEGAVNNGNIVINSAIGAADITITANGTLGNGNITVNAAVTGGNNPGDFVSLTASNDITTTATGTISGYDVSLNAGNTATLAANVTGGNQVSLQTGASITDAQVGFISAPSVVLTSVSGDIGSLGNFVDTTASSLTLSAASGSVFVNNNGNVALQASSALNDFRLSTGGVNGGSITVDGALSGNTIVLDANTAVQTGDVIVNAAITGTGVGNSLSITADNDITTNAGGTIDVGGLGFNAGGDISIGANVHGTDPASTFSFTSTGGFSSGVGTLIDAFSVSVSGSTISLGGTIDTTAFGAGNNASLTVTSGDLSATTVSSVATDTLSLTASAGNIGALGAEILTTVANLSLNASNDAYVINDGDLNILGVTAGGILNVSTDGTGFGGDITVSGAVSAFDVIITANAGGVSSGLLTVNNTVSGTASVDLTAADILFSSAPGTISGPSIQLTSTGADVDLSGDVTGTGLTSSIIVTADGSVTTNAGAQVTGNQISVVATTGSITLGDTVTASGTSNSVSLSSFGNITGSSVAQVTAESLSLTSTNGSVGTDFSGGEIVIAGVTNLTVNAAADSFIRINSDINLVGTNVVVGNFSFGGGVTGGSIDVTGTVNAGQFNTSLGGTNGGDLTVSSTGSVTAGAMNLFTFSGTGANGDVTVSGVLESTNSISFNAAGDITTTGAAFIEADFISFNAANINVTTRANGASVIATGVTGATIVNQGNFNLQGATVTNTLDVSTDATIGGDITVSGLSTADVLNLTANSGTLPANGDIILDAAITGTTSVTLTADGSITDNVNTITGSAITLTAGSDVNATVTNNANPLTLAVTAGGNADIEYVGTNTLTLNSSSAVDFTFVSTQNTGFFATGGDSTFTGVLSITANDVTNNNDIVATQVNVQSLAGSGLTFDGGGGAGGSWDATAGNVTVRATANDLTIEGITTYLAEARLFANQNGQSVDLTAGSNSIATVQSYIFTSSLTGTGTLTGLWTVTNAGTFANNPGDVTLTGALTFAGDVALIATGNIDLTGATIDMSGASGFDLTMIAGYDFTPNTGGVQVIDVSTVFNTFTANATGGSIIGGATINTSGTAGAGGDIVAIANGGSNVGSGTIDLGSITATGTTTGGSVTMIAENGITLTGTVDTTGTTTGGNVTLAVADANVPGTFQILNGTASGGAITVGTATSGNLSFGSINAGSGDVTLSGATLVGETISKSGTLTADELTVNTGAGTANLGTTVVNTLSGAGNGDVTVNNTGALALGTFSGNQNVVATSTGAITGGAGSVGSLTLTGDATAGNAAIDLNGTLTATNFADLTSTGGGDIRGGIDTGNLVVDSSGDIGVDASTRFASNASTMTANAVGSAFINATNATGVTFDGISGAGTTFDVSATANLSSTASISATNVVLNSGASFDLDASVSGSVIDLTSVNSMTNASFSGGLATGDLRLTVTGGDIGATGAGNEFDVSNGANPLSLTINAGTGDSFIDYTGTSVLTLLGSSGDNITLSTSGSGSSLVLGANSTFNGNVSLTTNDLTNEFVLTSNTGDIDIQSFAGSGLVLDGGAGGTLTATLGTINVTATALDLTLQGVMTYTTVANLFATAPGQNVVLDVGSNSIATVPSFIFTSSLTGTGSLTGPWNVVSSSTYANDPGDLIINANLTFFGSNIALIASGNIDLTGANIDLSGTTGGNLTMLAGYNFQPNTGGTQVNQNVTTTYDSFTPTGTGSIIGGTSSITLNGSNGNGGNLVAVANDGSVTLGNISATGSVGFNGGSVFIIGETGIATGTIDTTGDVVGGNVTLAVAQPDVPTGANFQILAGSVITGAVSVGTATSGNITAGAITAGGATVTVTGANGATDNIDLTAGVTADALSINTGSGTADASTTINTLNSASNGSVTVDNTGALALNTISGANQDLTASATGAITNNSAFSIENLTLTGNAASGNAAVTLANVTATVSANLSSTGGGDILGGISTGDLILSSSGNIGVDASTRFTTDASTMTANATGSAFISASNAGGVTIDGASGAGSTFDMTATGNLSSLVGGTIGATDVVLNTGGSFDLDGAVTGTTIDLTSVNSMSNASFSGGLNTGDLSLTVTSGDIGATGVGNALNVTNGANPLSLTVNTGTGDSFIDYTGTDVLTLLGSSGDDFTATTSGLGSSFATGANSTFNGNVSITTNDMTNAFVLTSDNGNIAIQSLAGSGLNIDGGAGGSMTATNGTITVTATDNDLVIDGNMTYTTVASLAATGAGQSVITNVGSVTTANVPSFILTSNLLNNGSLVVFTPPTGGQPGDTWTVVNSGTYANNTGDLSIGGNFDLSGANLAFISSGNVDLSGATFDLSGSIGGNLVVMAGFDFDPAGTNVSNNTTIAFDNFVANATGGDISIGTVDLQGTAGVGGSLVALANGGSSNVGSITLSSVNVSGTTGGGNVIAIGSGGVTSGAITATGGTGVGGAVILQSADPTVGANFTIQAGTITAGADTISNTGLTAGNVSVGNVDVGNGIFVAETAGGALNVGGTLVAHDILLTANNLNFTSLTTLASTVDAGDNGGDIIINANAVTTTANNKLIVDVNGTGAGDAGTIVVNWGGAPVTIGNGLTDNFQFFTQATGTGDGGSTIFNSASNVSLNAGAFTGNSGGSGSEAHVFSNGNIAVNDSTAFNLTASNGSGAVIELDANGTLAMGGNVGFLSQANASAGSNGDGGALIFTANNITFDGVIGSTAVNALNLTAQGDGTGDGGTVVYSTNNTALMLVGQPTGKAPKAPFFFIQANATGGGDAGSIELATGGGLTVSNLALLNASSTFSAGGALEGANYSLTAGRNGALGALFVNGSLNAAGSGGGDGGDVTLASRSSTAFAVNPTKASTNGISGTVTTGPNGSVTINNFAGGITLTNAGAVVANEQHYTFGGSKGGFKATGFTINSVDELSIVTTGAGAIGGKTPILVNTADLTLQTGGTVGVTNSFAGPSVLQDSFGLKGFTLRTAGGVTVNDITANAAVLVVAGGGSLNVANGATITANNSTAVLQNTNTATGTINIGDDARVQTLGTKGKSVSIVVGTTIPTTGTNKQSAGTTLDNINIVYADAVKNSIWFGGPPAAVVGPGGLPTDAATVESKNQNVIFSGPSGSITLGERSYILADPPSAAELAAMSAPKAAAAMPVVDTKSAVNTAASVFGFLGENVMATADLSVANLNAAPQVQVANNATLITATNTSELAKQAGLKIVGGAINAGTIGLAGVVGTSTVPADADEDNSYMVGFCSSTGETEAAICSDAEVGITEGSTAAESIYKVAHSERVVIKKGNVLFVPFKNTTVETPNGIVHIDAKSVALVSSTDAGLAVYDLEDQHKGSVSVESNGHNVVLSPGRHVMITKHHGAEFAQINAVETIAHRNVQSTVKNGHRAHTSEFSVLTAMDTVKPLKALAMSKHANAKQIADRMMKTTAIILQLGGNAGQYQHYFKPRMTAKM